MPTMLNHDLTPRIAKHALDRCAEMGVSTKVAKAIYRTPGLIWPCRRRPNQRPNTSRFHIVSDHWPHLGVVVEVADDDPTNVCVVTLLEWHGDGTGKTRTQHIERKDHDHGTA